MRRKKSSPKGLPWTEVLGHSLSPLCGLVVFASSSLRGPEGPLFLLPFAGFRGFPGDLSQTGGLGLT